MLNDPRLFLTRRLPFRLRWLVLGWLAAEIVVFVALVRTIGLGTTILLGFATTLLGIVTMRRIGLGAVASLNRTAMGGQPPAGALADGMLAGLGAVLLIIPGFIANFVGLALASPSLRRKAGQVFDGGSAGPDPRLRGGPKGGPKDVIDLGPGDWSPVDPP
jgi:UPF0716 protein FxsA